MTTTNQDRVIWARRAISEHIECNLDGPSRADMKEAATDLLANLRHWCDANDVAFHEIDRMAQAHYLTEKAQPEAPKTPAPQAQIA